MSTETKERKIDIPNLMEFANPPPDTTNFGQERKTREKTCKSNFPEVDHPHSEYSKFKKNPPIPILNIVIDNKTLEILEDNTGQP